MRVESSRGIALIIVLWLVAVIGTITILFTSQSTLSLKINRNINEADEARSLAEAGVYRFVAELVKDGEETTSDNLQEPWADNSQAFGDVLLGQGVYRVTRPDPEAPNNVLYGGTDECGKLNINTATRDQLLRLPNATEEVIDCILDWRDSDEEPREYGAENEYYQTLPEPYQAKNTDFDSVEELLLVKGMTLDLLYGEDTNLNGILDANENDGDKSYPVDNSDNQLDRGWYPYITAYSYEKNVTGEGEKRININTATQEELQESFSDDLTSGEINSIISVRDQSQFQSVAALLNSQSSGGNSNNNNRGSGNNNGGSASVSISREKLKSVIDRMTISDEEELPGLVNINTAPREVLQCLFPDNEELVNQIIEYRQSSDGPFDNIGELLDVEGITDDQFQQVGGMICTKSAVFSVRATGYLERSRAYKEIYAVVDRGVDPPEFRYWKVLR